MKNFALAKDSDKKMLLEETAAVNGRMSPQIIEKDFWVYFMLKHLFQESKYRGAFVFKGGTSLSKAYHVIERFSEDIDLILDWRKIGQNDEIPWQDRSKTKQDQFNKWLNKEAAGFYARELVPVLNQELSALLGENQWCSVDETDEMIVNFFYPTLYEASYLRPEVRLEIGPLAEWTPSHEAAITPFVEEFNPGALEDAVTKVLTIDVERTFWEKITILHKIANFPESKTLPARYARHLYDVYCMGHSEVKNRAFERRDLLARDVLFKQKFYYTKASHYETATLKDVVLIPSERIRNELRSDYQQMKEMIYGEIPDFEEILQYLEVLQEEIHGLAND